MKPARRRHSFKSADVVAYTSQSKPALKMRAGLRKHCSEQCLQQNVPNKN